MYNNPQHHSYDGSKPKRAAKRFRSSESDYRGNRSASPDGPSGGYFGSDDYHNAYDDMENDTRRNRQSFNKKNKEDGRMKESKSPTVVRKYEQSGKKQVCCKKINFPQSMCT